MVNILVSWIKSGHVSKDRDLVQSAIDLHFCCHFWLCIGRSSCRHVDLATPIFLFKPESCLVWHIFMNHKHATSPLLFGPSGRRRRDWCQVVHSVGSGQVTKMASADKPPDIVRQWKMFFSMLVFILTQMKEVSSIKCFCLGHCPDNQLNGTCIAPQGAPCFSGKS